MATPEQRMRDLYGFAFPDSFFAFRDFLAKLPPNILGDTCDLWPCFPFAAADGAAPRDYPERPRWQDRYYHDLPEFVTIFGGTTDGLHWGYFFDAPGEREPSVAHYWHSDTFEHALDGADIFSAVRYTVERSEVGFLEMIDDDPGEKDHYRMRIEQCAFLREQMGAYWGADRPETGEEYTTEYDDESRDEITAETWDRMGIIVPPGTYAELSNDLTAYSRLDPEPGEVAELTAEAMGLLRDGFPGSALKLGRDLWCRAHKFPQSYDLLDAAYAALGRGPLRAALREARAFQEHCDSRRRK